MHKQVFDNVLPTYTPLNLSVDQVLKVFTKLGTNLQSVFARTWYNGGVEAGLVCCMFLVGWLRAAGS